MGGAAIGRRWVSEETPAEDGDEDDEDDEEEGRPAKKAPRKGAKTGKLTPMELQVLDIKRKHMDTLLIIEVGYKFRFFGDDARVAAKELGIVCIPGRFRYDERTSPLPFLWPVNIDL
jgi:DNA mismatch repair protein MSH3